MAYVDSNALFRLDGKVGVVTGAARGIGRASAAALARAGADVVGIDILYANAGIQAFKHVTPRLGSCRRARGGPAMASTRS